MPASLQCLPQPALKFCLKSAISVDRSRRNVGARQDKLAPSDRDIDALIHALSRADVAADAFNEYAPGEKNNAIRRENLRLYLRALAGRGASVLLLLEAPGYRGCRLTGVPVTSRKVLLGGIPELKLFGRESGYQDVSDPGFERVYGEQSATILWSTLAELKALPVIWNTYPFHPQKAGQPLSNRRPRRAEIELGGYYLRRLLDMWQFEQIIAVGRVAQEALLAQGLDCQMVRHPAHGGKKDFVAGLTALFSVGS